MYFRMRKFHRNSHNVHSYHIHYNYTLYLSAYDVHFLCMCTSPAGGIAMFWFVVWFIR